MGQLAGGVLHDFSNVLTVIAGVIGLMAEAVAHEPQLAAMAKLIDDVAARGAALTSSLLVRWPNPDSAVRSWLWKCCRTS